ncbi:MAG: pilus assembly protein [Pirellulales bacterium]|nr:pilus assembly protein [Pirellulales bacterium]
MNNARFLNSIGRRRTQRRHRRGASVVEFALVAPVFFMLLIGIIEVGRALMIQQVLVNASRVGARQAVVLTSSTDAVTSAVADYATGIGVAGVATTVTPNPGTATAGTPITVTTSVDFSNVSWIPSPWFMGGKTITASSVMRKEGF